MTSPLQATVSFPIDDGKAADILGVSRSQVSKIRRRLSLPSLSVAVEIEDRFGIPPRFWVKGDESEKPADKEVSIVSA